MSKMSTDMSPECLPTDTVIYSFKLSVRIDIDVLNLYELTKENLLAGKPQIRQEKESGKIFVVLYTKDCGRFPDAFSSGLSDVTHLKLAKIQAYVYYNCFLSEIFQTLLFFSLVSAFPRLESVLNKQ